MVQPYRQNIRGDSRQGADSSRVSAVRIGGSGVGSEGSRGNRSRQRGSSSSRGGSSSKKAAAVSEDQYKRDVGDESSVAELISAAKGSLYSDVLRTKSEI